MRHLVPTLALAVLRLLDASWRYRETGREHFEAARNSGRPVVGAFLHGRTFMLLCFMAKAQNGRWLSMCSKSLDGDAMTQIEERLGFEVVRGSSGRDGLQAIVDMIRRVRADPELGSCLAIDGSRGPRGRVQGGIVSLAQRTGGLIVPITASARPARILGRTWDRTLLALPFARVEVVYGEPFAVPARMRSAEFESWQAELEQRFSGIQEAADRAAGFGDPQGVRDPGERGSD